MISIEISHSVKSGYTMTLIDCDVSADTIRESTFCEHGFRLGCLSCRELGMEHCEGGCATDESYHIVFKGSSSRDYDEREFERLLESTFEKVERDDRPAFLIALLELAGRLNDGEIDGQ